MKKGIALLLAGLLLSLAACSSGAGASGGEIREMPEAGETVTESAQALSEETVILPEETDVAQSWTLTDSPLITPDLAELVNQATAGFLGADCTPLVNIGTRENGEVCLLCMITPTVPNSPSTLSILSIASSESDTPEVVELMDSPAEVAIPGAEGGWTVPEFPILTEAALWAFDESVSWVTDVAYNPIALVSTQVITGMNYCILCHFQQLSENGTDGFALVYVFADPEGSSVLTDTVEFRTNEG